MFDTLVKRIFIVDDHQMVVDGLQALLQNVPGVELVGQTNTPSEVVQLLEKSPADILLTDINMPNMSGVELTRIIKKKFPATRILALSMYGERQVISEMIDAGVSGYILKNTGKEELLEAIDRISKGQSYFGYEVTQELMKDFKNTQEASSHLTNREIEIIRLIEKEQNNKRIADTLFISERTVETHRKNIFRKTNTQSIVGLIKYAYEHKII